MPGQRSRSIYARCFCIRTSIISRTIFAIIQLSGLLSSCRSQLSSYQTGPDLLAINSDRDASIDDAAAINMLAMAVPGTPGTYTIKLVLPFNNCHKIMARFGLRLLPQNYSFIIFLELHSCLCCRHLSHINYDLVWS